MRALLYILVFALALYAVLDCVRTPSENMPANLPKPVWILIILVMTVVGPLAWIITSRVRAAEERGGEIERTVWSSQESAGLHLAERPRPMAPDDDPEFLAGLDRDIQRRRRQERRHENPDVPKQEGDEGPGDDPNGRSGADGPGIPSDDSPTS
ncbi:PLD nuclease N-terminal domain-containing protein [Actinomyces sp.]|uniref:PLD nuclease N-terminal domain-containing protein n=1 Tax=Actinomyces sp. TaxID=29317 RepID=UPI0026DB8F9A|nr:PLD nuclease N-terminal domain-containing protein [Actinomyces sp.]MDO4899235.1 PLD nuclease N-terminal domain-containing protein [Actinomyces sp.]